MWFKARAVVMLQVPLPGLLAFLPKFSFNLKVPFLSRGGFSRADVDGFAVTGGGGGGGDAATGRGEPTAIDPRDDRPGDERAEELRRGATMAGSVVIWFRGSEASGIDGDRAVTMTPVPANASSRSDGTRNLTTSLLGAFWVRTGVATGAGGGGTIGIGGFSLGSVLTTAGGGIGGTDGFVLILIFGFGVLAGGPILILETAVADSVAGGGGGGGGWTGAAAASANFCRFASWASIFSFASRLRLVIALAFSDSGSRYRGAMGFGKNRTVPLPTC
jgi:hypothetical protein